jgi:hypothetical protein
MKKFFLFVFALAFIASTINAESGKKYGKGVSLKEKTNVSDILENPEEFIGKKVRVEGMVVDVCSKRGCWIEIASNKEFQKIKVKVNDGEIVFPMELKGKTAVVEGEVYEIKLSKEDALKHAEHEAEEYGKKFDPESITGPVTLYQIKGLGAVVK